MNKIFKYSFFFLIIIIVFTLNVLASQYSPRFFNYGQDFNLTNPVFDINGFPDYDYSSDCNITAKHENNNLLVLDNNLMLPDLINSGVYYISIPASNTLVWNKGKYTATMTCIDYNLAGSDDVSFVIDVNLSQTVNDVNQYLGNLIIDVNAVGKGLTSDQNKTLYEVQDALTTKNYDDDLNAYSNEERLMPIAYGETFNAEKVIYLRGSSDTLQSLPTHYSLNGVVTLINSNNQAFEVDSISRIYVINGYLYTSFIMPEVPIGDYNILLEAYDSKTTIGNDIIRGATDKLLLGGTATKIAKPTLNPAFISQTVNIEKENSNLKQEDIFLGSIIIFILIIVMYIILSLIFNKFSIEILTIIVVVMLILIAIVFYLMYGVSGFENFLEWITQVFSIS